MAPATYRRAGVDVEGADAWLKSLQPLIKQTHRAGVMRDKGQFAGLFRLAHLKQRDPVLVASADGVGTKLKIAQVVGMHEAIGIDLVAMNTNDVVVYGAEPLFFLDYIAVGGLNRPVMTQLIRGIVEGCRLSGCALLGGETAEMPGVYAKGEYDLAGFCVGIAERKRLIDGSAVCSGDIVVGLASSGVHANGFSLIRKALTSAQIKRWARQLLEPTRIYVPAVLRAIHSLSIHAVAHITGGGLLRRLPSLVGAHRRALRVMPEVDSWPVPEIFRLIQQAGSISEEEMMRTFNMGVGMTLACARRDVVRLVRLMNRQGIEAWPIGVIKSKE